jgi:hypothetical protein
MKAERERSPGLPAPVGCDGPAEVEELVLRAVMPGSRKRKGQL